MIRLNHRKTKEEQFSEKITEIQNKLYRLAYCYVKNEQEALDIVSEAVYKGFIAYGKMESMTYFDSWMSRIVINTAIDHIRRNQRVTYMEDMYRSLWLQSEGHPWKRKWICMMHWIDSCPKIELILY
ncbi:DNA-directed RNA polymerase specialized sigma24 family protein [Paenibacillus sp. W4I10]|uniref:RNA polymerase sigma factor n=1 Tax=Paenibacillus sp. W4I10 TaxID=3042298 RepID=UPI002786F98A|nr:sigma factor [Paenibacillus sp. W4I10]MDQ0723067.1 DNA-directed RNA polymerase specialized sigma24 family protein [Paenibacillus sp. W4I10]